MIAEDADVLDLLQAGRVHLGVVRAQPVLPPDIAVARLQVNAEIAIYIHRDHPLAQQTEVTESALEQVRQLRLNTWVEPHAGTRLVSADLFTAAGDGGAGLWLEHIAALAGEAVWP